MSQNEQVAGMQKAHLALKQRAVNVELGLQGKLPQNGKPLASQQAVTQAFSKLKLINLLNEQIEGGLQGFGKLLREDSPLLAGLLQSVGKELGVENSAVLLAIVATLEGLVALLELEVVQLEKLAESAV